MVDYQLKNLAFVHNGTVLLQSTQIKSTESKEESRSVVVGWNLSTATLQYTCRGSLSGVSRDGSTFLTTDSMQSANDDEKRVYLWESATGTEIALEDVDPNSYDLHQRILMSPQNASHLKLQIEDVFKQFPSTIFERVNYNPFDLDVCVMTPNDRYLILTLSGDMDGFEWTDGLRVEIVAHKTGIHKIGSVELGKMHRLDVDRGVPQFSFSKDHQWMTIARTGRFDVYGLDPWRIIGKFAVEGFCNRVSFSPQNRWFAAVGTTKYEKTNEYTSEFVIHLLDLKYGILKDGERYGNETGVIEETGTIKQLLFHPNGQYLASLLMDGSLHLWDTESCQFITDLSMS